MFKMELEEFNITKDESKEHTELTTGEPVPATFKSFNSCFLDTGQKHIPYTMGPR